jgi:spermidine synthase
LTAAARGGHGGIDSGSTPMMPNRRLAFPAVSLLTFAIIVFELALTRVFSATLYYHFAFVAISLALFGLGASGVLIYLFGPRPTPAEAPRWLAGASALFGLGVVLGLVVLLANPVSLEGGAANYARLALIYSAASVPFFFGGCAVTLAIQVFRAEAGRVYFFDLFGAALGCVVLIPAVNALGAINAILLTAVLGAAAGLLFSLSGPRHGPSRAFAATATVGLGAALAGNLATGFVGLQAAKGYAEHDVLLSKWNSFSHVAVVGDPQERRLRILIDSDASTEIYKGAGDPQRHPRLARLVQGLVYHAASEGPVLVIGAGGGADVMIARQFGARDITAVEINPIIARDVMSSEPFRTYSGALFEQPGVRLVVDEGRSFIRRSSERYAVIHAAMVDTWAATAAGAFTLTENHLYTVEAFHDYVERLQDDGILAITRWYLDPPDQMLRLVSLARAVMGDRGVGDVSRHLVIARAGMDAHGRALCTLLLKRSPFSEDEVGALEAAAAANEIELVYTPRTRLDNDFRRLIEAPDPERVWGSYPTNIAPVWDDSPFFFNSVRVSDLGALMTASPEWRKTNLGTLSLMALLVISIVLVSLFILLPLALARGRSLRQGRGAGRALRHIAYFGFLGAGFILVEVAMIQKCILFLGHPVYALAVVLFGLLVFSALGSWRSSRTRDADLARRVRQHIGFLVAVLLLYAAILTPLFQNTVDLPRGTRIALTVLLLAPLGLAMGVPMPSGIRVLSMRASGLIPWAWGINGAASVTGSIAALVLALFAGFNLVLLIGTGFYVGAALLLADDEQ